MKINARETKGVAILELQGDVVDVSHAGQVRDRLREFVSQGIKKAVFDLSKVTLMNSLGVGILISALTTMKSNQGELKLSGVTERIKSLLVITRLVTIFETYNNIEEALKSFKSKDSTAKEQR